MLSHDLIPPHVNFSHLTAKDYNEMYRVIMTVKEGHFKELGLDACLLEDELDKVPHSIPNGTEKSLCPLAVPAGSCLCCSWHTDLEKLFPVTLQGWEFPVPGVFPGSKPNRLTATSTPGVRVDFSFLEELFSGTREL